MVDPFFNSRCGQRMPVLPATHPSFRRPSSLTTGWNLPNLHWVDQSTFKLVQKFQLNVEIWLPCQPTILSKTSGQISKELGTNHP